MSFKQHVFFFASICSILHSSLSCTFDVNDERAHCYSFSALKEQGTHLEWRRLNVINSGREPFSSIESETFKGCPNVQDLQVKGIANGIEPYAWVGLNKLFELHLDDNKIQVIPKNAFAGLTIEKLYMFFCGVRELVPKAFNNLPKLRHVDIYQNNISVIKMGVFTDTDLTHLYLRKNHIKSVESNAFGNMDYLVLLNLEGNELTTFLPQLAIGFASKLTHLYMHRNKLTNATRAMFTVMPNLEILLININMIERFGDNVFQDLRNLRFLDMSNNKLEEIQTNIFNSRGMKDLQSVLIHDNKLSFLSTEVLKRLPNLKKITVGGNPWQCPCLKSLDSFLEQRNIIKLCDDAYKFGQRPSCAYSEITPSACIYDIEKVKDVPKTYEDQIKEYTKLPPVCNVDAEKPVLVDR